MGAPLTRQEHEEIGYAARYANLKGDLPMVWLLMTVSSKHV